MKNPLLEKLLWVEVPLLAQKMAILWEPVLKTTNVEQLCPAIAEYRFYKGAFSAGSQDGFRWTDG
jgi:hypothetical protein